MQLCRRAMRVAFYVVIGLLTAFLLLAGLARRGISRFLRADAAALQSLLDRSVARMEAKGAPALLSAEDLVSLPAPVRRWLSRSGAVGLPRAITGYLRQRGEMRTQPTGPFMPARATQVFTFDEPGFVWCVEVRMAGFLPVVGRDSYREGHGRMYIRAAGLVTVADGSGPTFDQGTLLRWLGEIVWFPSAALSPAVRWEAIDDRSARATVVDKGTSVSAIFHFDERDRVVALVASRYFDGKSLERWEIPLTAWSEMGGVTIPTRGTAIWRLPTGDFEYYRWEILEVLTNVTSVTPRQRP